MPLPRASRIATTSSAADPRSPSGSPQFLPTARWSRPISPRATLRFYAGLKHPSSGVWPAMVGLVTRGSDDTPLAIHRTILTRNGGKAPVNPQKMMLGPCRGGAVRLGPPGDVLMVSERYWKAPRLQQQGGRP
jgi:putative DNA primase/helicase